MNISFRFLSYCILACSLLACTKDDSPDVPSSNTPSGLFGSAITLNVVGVVRDEAGAPVEGATVTAGFSNHTTTTDAYGTFRLEGISGYTSLGLVRISKLGYFPGSRSFLPVGTLNTVRIVLLTRTEVGTFNATTGGQVQADGALVSFASDGFVRDGLPYTGTVRVYMEQLDPNAVDFADRMPGNLLAVQDNVPRMLLSYGMLAVELTDDVGNEVELAPGTTAVVRFPITASQQGNAPSEIDLWSYDEGAGHWQHEGTAERQGNEYVAQVAHFSFWNCDVPADYVQLTGTVYVGGSPVSGAIVTITSGSSGSATDCTDPSGNFGGLVPSGQPLSLTVSIDCEIGGSQVHTQDLGVLMANTNLGVVEVTIPLLTLVTGTVVACNGQPLANGFVQADGQIIFCEGGQISFTLCAGTSVTLIGIDPVAGAVSASVTLPLSGPVVDAGELAACEQGGGGAWLNPILTYDTMSDQDGNAYATIMIGGHEWMAENLRSTTYANGDPIPNVTDNSSWSQLTTGAWAFVQGDSGYNYPYGKLYNGYAVTDSRNVCPSGWHVPTDGEWMSLESALGMPYDELSGEGTIRGEDQNVAGRMRTANPLYGSDWLPFNNESGFSGLAGGERGYSGDYWQFGIACWWWSSTETYADQAWFRALLEYDQGVLRNDFDMNYGYGVRCVRD